VYRQSQSQKTLNQLAVYRQSQSQKSPKPLAVYQQSQKSLPVLQSLNHHQAHTLQIILLIRQRVTFLQVNQKVLATSQVACQNLKLLLESKV
jgi:hypothetical protein